MSSGANIGDGGRTGSATRRSTWAPGRSSSSAGWAAPTNAGHNGVATTASIEHKLGPTTPRRSGPGAGHAPARKAPDERRSRRRRPALAYWSAAATTWQDPTKTFQPGRRDADRRPLATTPSRDFDYFFVEMSADDGATWSALRHDFEAGLGRPRRLNDSGTGIAGSSGGLYKSLTSTSPLRRADRPRPLRYETDSTRAGAGVAIDNIAITGNERRRRRDGRAGERVDERRLRPADERRLHDDALQRVHRREPAVRRVRLVAEDGVQLRLARRATRSTTMSRATRSRTAC